ncbi:MAG: hypothetical protein HQK83_20330, partial [Fibrobacteria bacterium]|nr:hypothetical protein [Fibrobacteria bacterium]
KNLEQKHFKEIITYSLLHNSNMENQFYRCQESDSCIVLNNIKYESSQQMEKTVSITISPIKVQKEAPGETDIFYMLSFLYSTEKEELQFQLDIIRELGVFMIGTVDLDRLLFLILTGATAGPALGFNRAFILLVDQEKKFLRNGMGVGPTSAEEAGKIWDRVSSQKKALRDFLSEYDIFPDKKQLPMSILAEHLQCDLNDTDNILVKTVMDKKVHHIQDAYNDPLVSESFIKVYRAHEFITAPLIAEEEVVGVLIADNMFNHQPISSKHKRFLAVFTFLAGITIQNAFRHLQLQDKIKQLKNMFQLLNEADKAMSDMEQFATVGKTAGFVAHEIRNPLTTIGGFARSTLKHIQDQTKVIRNAEIIVSEVRRLEELLKNVLDYLRKTDPVISNGDMNGLILELIEQLGDAAEEKKVHLESKLANNMPTVSFDPQLMKQALMNLISNAVSFSPPDKSVIIEDYLDGDRVVVKITDYGCGISEEDQGKLFTPFFTTKDGGVGLGLSITKRIIDAHHGEIKYFSKQGKFTTVRITLPV